MGPTAVEDPHGRIPRPMKVRTGPVPCLGPISERELVAMDAKNRFHAVGDRTQGAASLHRIEDPGHQVRVAPRRLFERGERR